MQSHPIQPWAPDYKQVRRPVGATSTPTSGTFRNHVEASVPGAPANIAPCSHYLACCVVATAGLIGRNLRRGCRRFRQKRCDFGLPRTLGASRTCHQCSTNRNSVATIFGGRFSGRGNYPHPSSNGSKWMKRSPALRARGGEEGPTLTPTLKQMRTALKYMHPFVIKDEFKCLKGDQPEAVQNLVDMMQSRPEKDVLLHGATGTGKTLATAHVISELGRPALLCCPTSDLMWQAYNAFKRYFVDEDAICAWQSPFQQYIPESVDANGNLRRPFAEPCPQSRRHRQRTLERIASGKPAIIVATVSALFEAGDPCKFESRCLTVGGGLLKPELEAWLEKHDLQREWIPTSNALIVDAVTHSVRIDFEGARISMISVWNDIAKRYIAKSEHVIFATPRTSQFSLDERAALANSIQEELDELQPGERLRRLSAEVRKDIQSIKENGTCLQVLEKYRKHTAKVTKARPGSLFHVMQHYYGNDFLVVVDESHLTVPNFRSIGAGEFAREQGLVQAGFRLPSVLETPRHYSFSEVCQLSKRGLFLLSATPSAQDLEGAGDRVVTMEHRPSGIMDPAIEFRDSKTLLCMIDGVFSDLMQVRRRGYQSLMICYSRVQAVDKHRWLIARGFKAGLLTSLNTKAERQKALDDFRMGKLHVLVGCNLLREGLDFPHVELVVILDAGKGGFLRCVTSLIQMVGRAARNSKGRAHMYSRRVSDAMLECKRETDERRERQRCVRPTADPDVPPHCFAEDDTAVREADRRPRDDTVRPWGVETPQAKLRWSPQSNKEELASRFGVKPTQVPQYIALVGDGENYAGIEYIGSMRARLVIDRFDLKRRLREDDCDVFCSPDGIGPVLGKRLFENRKRLLQNILELEAIFQS